MKSHNWHPGAKFLIEETTAGLILKPAGCFPSTVLEDGLGCAGYSGVPKAVEEMKEGIDEVLKREWHKGRGR